MSMAFVTALEKLLELPAATQNRTQVLRADYTGKLELPTAKAESGLAQLVSTCSFEFEIKHRGKQNKLP